MSSPVVKNHTNSTNTSDCTLLNIEQKDLQLVFWIFLVAIIQDAIHLVARKVKNQPEGGKCSYIVSFTGCFTYSLCRLD